MTLIRCSGVYVLATDLFDVDQAGMITEAELNAKTAWWVDVDHDASITEAKFNANAFALAGFLFLRKFKVVL